MTFPEIVFFVLKGINTSTQIALNRFFRDDMQKEKYMTQQALSKARSHFDHSPFVKIFRSTLNLRYSGEHEVDLLYGYQVLAVDGTTVALPKAKTLLRTFGGTGSNADSPTARASVLCDVLNDFILDADIDGIGTGEREMAVRHFEKLSDIYPNAPKLLIFDRGYPGAELIDELNRRNFRFLMRVRRKWNLDVDALSTPEGVVRLSSGATLRVIRFELPGGAMETLITNLFELPFEAFPELYFKRWPIETKYDMLKNKLALENFSGCSKNIVLQDFWATMALCNFATVAKDEANAELRRERAKKGNKYEYVPNLNNLIAALKDHLVAAVFLSDPAEKDRHMNAIRAEIRRAVVPIRPNRSVQRPVSPRKARFHHNRKFPA